MMRQARMEARVRRLNRAKERGEWDAEDSAELEQYIEAIKADIESRVLTGNPIRLNS